MLTRFFKKDSEELNGTIAQPEDQGDATVMLTASSAEDVDNDESGWQPGDIIQERYKVEQVFSGAMGKVYIATHLGWDVKMAIKAPRKEVLSDEEGVQRIVREADGWVKLGLHPNIASCYYVLAIDKIPHIFEKFFRVDNSDTYEIEGTGLGLSIVKHIIDSHHGKITVDSIIDKGSVFTFSLPLKRS